MKILRRFIGRLTASALGRRDDDRLRDEFQEHLTLLTEDHVRGGLSPEEAGRKARLSLGPQAAIAEAYRDEQRLGVLEDLATDVRHGVRSLWRAPTFSVVAVVTLALGIGANVAVFSAVRAVLIDDLPYADAGALVTLLPADHMRGAPFGPAHITALQALPALATVAGCSGPDVIPLRSSPQIRAVALEVTPDFFRLFGVAPQLGRLLTPDDFAPGTKNVVISADMWQTMFARDPSVLGRSVTLARTSWTVVGVMPPAFAPPCFDVDRAALSWIPAGAMPEGRLQTVGMTVIARLAADVRIETAQAQVDTVTARIVTDTGDGRFEYAFLEPLGASLTRELEPGLLLLQCVSILLLLITCASLANLFLVNATERHAEFVVRAGLGAGRGRLARQVCAEAGVIATAGAGLGVALAFAASAWLRSLAASVLPPERAFHIDVADLVFGLTAGWFTAVLFGAVPALISVRAGAPGMTRGATLASASPRLGRLRSSLVGAQVACSVILLITSGLLTRSHANAMAVPAGFEARGVLTTEMYLPEGGGDDVNRRLRAVMSRIEAELTGVAGALPVAFSSTPVFSGGRGVGWGLRLPGQGEYLRRSFHVRSVSHAYFSTLGIPLRRGRSFGTADGASVSAAVVSEEFVREFGQGRDLLGGEVRSRDLSYAIVGVVGDVRTTWLTQPARPTVYVPIDSERSIQLSVVVRTASPAAVTRALRDAVRRANPDGPAVAVERLDAIVWRSEERRRFSLVLVSIFAALAGIVAAVGIYGVVARSTAVRAKEFGVRLALGAHPPTLMRRVIAQGLRPVVLGGLVGLAGAWWSVRLLDTSPFFGAQLFEVSAHDPWTFIAVPAAALSVSIVAAWIPARRVSQASLAKVLRTD